MFGVSNKEYGIILTCWHQTGILKDDRRTIICIRFFGQSINQSKDGGRSSRFRHGSRPVFVFLLYFLFPSRMSLLRGFRLNWICQVCSVHQISQRTPYRDMDRSTGRGMVETRDTMRQESNDRGIDKLRQWRNCKMKGFTSRQTRAEDMTDRTRPCAESSAVHSSPLRECYTVILFSTIRRTAESPALMG